MKQWCEVDGAGNLGTEPKVRYLPSGTPVVNVRVCTHRRWKTEDGEWINAETWVNLVFEGDLATDLIAAAVPIGSIIVYRGNFIERALEGTRKIFEVRVLRWHTLAGQVDNPTTVDHDYFI